MLITLKEGGLKRKQFPKNDFFSTQSVLYNVPRNFFADAAISERIVRDKDGKTYMIPSNINYKDWERVYVKKEISLEQRKNSLSKQQKDVIIKVTKTISGHAKVPIKDIPNSIVDFLGKDGKTNNRVFYDDKGYLVKQINPNDHGNPKQHPYGSHGEHAHVFIWQNGKMIDRYVRALLEHERKENQDIL